MATQNNLTRSNVKDKKTLQDAEDVIGKQDALPIVDPNAFQEYERLGKHPILNEKKMWTSPSTGDTFNLGRLPHHLQKDIEDLPIEEQQKVMTLKKVYNQIQNKRTGLFRQAYGTNVKGDGTKATDKVTSTLDLKRPELIELFGRMFSLEEVHELIVKAWQLPLKKAALAEWRQNNLQDINNRIEQHKREYSDIRLAHKRSRLEELTWLYSQRKNIYQTTKKGEDHRLLLQTLEQIKKEIEGDTIRIDASLTLDANQLTEGLQDTFNFISLKEIVIARVAAKTGVDVKKVVMGMSRGYYFKNLHAEEPTTEMPPLPSNQTYDFDRIANINAQRQQQKEVEDAEVVSITTEETTKAVGIKELLLRKLKQKQEATNYAKNSLSPNFIDKANTNK